MNYFLVGFLTVAWIIPIVSFVDSFSFPFSCTGKRRAARSQSNAKPIHNSRITPLLCAALEIDASLEVVGAHGRIGSLFLREGGAVAVPRGVAPGCLTTDSPIIVAIPPNDWKRVFDTTLDHRKSDLVWVTDGQERLNRWQKNATVVILSPLELLEQSMGQNGAFVPGQNYVYGKHAAIMQTILSNQGITNVISEVNSWADLCDLVVAPVVSHTETSDVSVESKTISIPAIDLVCTGKQTNNSTTCKVQSVIVVGGGIIGSSIARALSQRGGPSTNITVYDPTPTGVATPASWAWLNANQKPPHGYKSLNQMGLRGWRSDALLSNLSSLKWSGTVVQTKEKLELTGGYRAEGPLSAKRIRELEPEANFTINSDFYYFADEGHVNPEEAVLAMRQEAADNGVNFVSDDRVVSLVSNSDGEFIGVKTASSKELLADVVIVAAGANSSDQALGGVPLVHNPSKTYFGSPSSSSSRLSRTLVDMVSSLYLAQRPDGTIVTGGGAIKFGLSATSEELSEAQAKKQLEMAQDAAQQLAPNPVRNSPLTHKNEVVSKPMPKDGFPILGYVVPGLYSAVTHSGMTLCPLIGQLVAVEVIEQVSLDILNDYRPTRFDNETQKHNLLDWQESEASTKHR